MGGVFWFSQAREIWSKSVGVSSAGAPSDATSTDGRIGFSGVEHVAPAAGDAASMHNDADARLGDVGLSLINEQIWRARRVERFQDLD